MKVPLLKDVMTPTPLFVDASATIESAQQLMQKHNIRHLPIMDNGNPEGVLSERDIKYASLPGHRATADEQMRVSDLCASRAYIADINDPLDKVIQVMSEQHIAEVVVLEDGELAGIFTEADTCKILCELLRSH